MAIVCGEPYTALPEDLYIPPDALEVVLEMFEGPLDLLLYLIKRQNVDILNIPIADITRQYVEYITLMDEMRWELAAEYLVMAAMLAEIKSRMLLPIPLSDEQGDEEDPRAELVRRLQEYERFKQAAECLDQLPQHGRDVFAATAALPPLSVEKPLPEVVLKDLLGAFSQVLKRAQHYTRHAIAREPVSIRERMTKVLAKLQAEPLMAFERLFTPEEGRMGVVVTFIAILELIKQTMLDIVQTAPYAPLYIKALNRGGES